MPRSIAVVLGHAVGEHRPVAGAPPDHPVEPHVHAAFLVERVTRVGPAGVGTHRALEAARIIAEEEVVVAPGIAPELRVVGVGRDRERRAALPAPDHLRPEQVLLGARGAARSRR